MFNNIAYIAFAIAAVSQIFHPSNFNLVFIGTCLFMAFSNRSNINICGLIFMVLTVKLVEQVAWLQISDSNNYVIFSTYLLLDICAVLLISLRIPITRWMEYKTHGSYDSERYKYTNADMFLGGIYLLYCIVNLLALFENALRHLDDFGLSQSQWLYENARFFWNNFEVIKHGINMLEFVVLQSTVLSYMRSPRVIQA